MQKLCRPLDHCLSFFVSSLEGVAAQRIWQYSWGIEATRSLALGKKLFVQASLLR
jgi:hypothetical protein